MLVVLLIAGRVVSIDESDEELSELDDISVESMVELSDEDSIAGDDVDEVCVDVSKPVEIGVELWWSVIVERLCVDVSSVTVDVSVLLLRSRISTVVKEPSKDVIGTDCVIVDV